VTESVANSAPLFSVVIPSLNQGQFIEQSILSVVGQGVDSVELIIIDGGSSDETLDVIRRNEHHIAYWSSEPDHGQAHAINKGFRRARGRILAWLNSDDFYLPGTLSRVARKLGWSAEPALVYGASLQFDELGTVAWGVRPAPFDPERLRQLDYIVQPSTFWTRSLWTQVGELDEGLHYAFDWDWSIRASQRCVFTPLNDYLSCYRIHEGHKTRTGGSARFMEVVQVVERHAAPEWVAAYRDVLYRVDRVAKQVRHLRSLRLYRLRSLFFPLLHLRHGSSRMDTVFAML